MSCSSQHTHTPRITAPLPCEHWKRRLQGRHEVLMPDPAGSWAGLAGASGAGVRGPGTGWVGSLHGHSTRCELHDLRQACSLPTLYTLANQDTHWHDPPGLQSQNCPQTTLRPSQELPQVSRPGTQPVWLGPSLLCWEGKLQGATGPGPHHESGH